MKLPLHSCLMHYHHLSTIITNHHRLFPFLLTHISHYFRRGVGIEGDCLDKNVRGEEWFFGKYVFLCMHHVADLIQKELDSVQYRQIECKDPRSRRRRHQHEHRRHQATTMHLPYHDRHYHNHNHHPTINCTEYDSTTTRHVVIGAHRFTCAWCLH